MAAVPHDRPYSLVQFWLSKNLICYVFLILTVKKWGGRGSNITIAISESGLKKNGDATIR
jgi:hypothetical protein